MLSMKTLRVAVAAALLSALLAPGAVLAQGDAVPDVGYNLDASRKAPPTHYALETLPPASVPTGRPSYSALMTPGSKKEMGEAAIRASVLLESDSRWYLRVALDGMAFAKPIQDGSDLVSVEQFAFNDNDTVTDDPDTTEVETNVNVNPDDDGFTRNERDNVDVTVVAGGDPGSSSVVFRINTTDPQAANSPVQRGDKIVFNFADQLAAPRRVGDYGMSMSLHSTANDAQSGANSVGGAGSATLVRVQSGLKVDIMANLGIEADVTTGFLWFTDPNPATPPNRAQADLGYAIVDVGGTGGDEMLYNARTGMEAEPENFVKEDSVGITVAGDLSIGAFSIVTGDVAECPAGRNADAPNLGNLTDGRGNKITEEGITDAGSVLGLAAGEKHHLCVDVDVNGPESNESPIPEGSYEATVSALLEGGDLDDPEALGEGVIGRIGRNGASVNIAYLTTSEKHNQRVIVVNRGRQPISIADYSFQTEDGTSVELTDAAMAAQAAGAMIAPGETVVRRVSDMIEISGDSRRTALTMSFNGLARNISVATTQVNLEDSSTDTVMWTVE